jgi:hypothetical protein
VYNLTVADAHEYFANGILVHNCDAGLYAFRHLTHYTNRPERDKPPVGSRAALLAEAERAEQDLDQRMARQQRAHDEGDELDPSIGHGGVNHYDYL